ncbi:MAG TPA: DUF1801 domain-containing protein [Casimicrobiaceae bacterium]|jgi:uncharacterized protein YdhG (YjbR/CyaY superfamily)
MVAARQAPASVDAYVAGFPPDVRAILERLRATARKLLPDAQETISYGIPTYRRDGPVVYFAAFKAHIGFYPPVRGDVALEKAVARYANDKGNLRFPLVEPLPMALIERIVRHQAKREASR